MNDTQLKAIVMAILQAADHVQGTVANASRHDDPYWEGWSYRTTEELSAEADEIIKAAKA